MYQLQCAKTQPGGEATLVSASYDGTVLCHSLSGKPIWENRENRGFPYDLAVGDLDGDGLDEALLASSDGALYAIDGDGKLLWTFRREPPLLQVAVSRGPDGRPIVLTGGMEKKLYALSAGGEVLSTWESPYAVRHIRSGDILGEGRDIAAVVTSKNDSSRCFLQLFEPAGLKEVWKKPVGLQTKNPTEGSKFYVPWAGYKVSPKSLLVLDIDGDGKEEVVMADAFDTKGEVSAYDAKGEKVRTWSTRGLRNRAYRMNLLSRIRFPGRETDHILGLFGNQIVIYGLEGKIETILDGTYAHTISAFDPRSRRLFLGSSVSGGDGIYSFDLADANWEAAFRNLKPAGKMERIERNLATFARQIEDFERPEYQRPPRPATVITGRSRDEIEERFLDGFDYRNVEFVQFNLFTENYDRDILEGEWKTKRETRHKYRDTAEEIIAFAAEREAKKEPFALWAGHGNDPFYLRLSTIEGLLKAAPTTARALVFPEMERTDDAMAYAVRSHLLPVAGLCQEHGVARVVLRNKNIFWNGSCYLDLWRDSLLGGEYRSVFVPSMEETNGRTQDVSLSGRMGLWLTGKFDRISGRAVTDNANFCRFWEWGAQQKQHHLVRSMALRAALGADLFLVNIYQGDERDMAPLYRMLEKGVIAIPNREELLSVSDVCLGMKTPSPAFLEHGKNGHDISGYAPDRPPLVFDRMDCYWGGAPTAEHDFARYGMGCDRRMLNFLPRNPYGLIASVPADTDLDAFAQFRTMLVTDGEVFYDDAGKKISPAEFRDGALARLEDAAARLPVRVRGDVAWTVARLDSRHVRVTLIDSGYLDPADRDAEVVLQHLDGVSCRDLLAKQDLPIKDSAVQLTVPAGILRVLDITHR